MKPDPATLAAMAAIASTAVALITVVVGVVINRNTLKTARETAEAAAWQKANEAELKVIQDRLDRFFGPFRQMSGVNRLMSRDLRDRQSDDRFILLEKLFDQTWIQSRPAGEMALIAEIAANAKALREFIAQHSGMVDEGITPYLSRVSAHYRILELAHAGKLGSDPAPFVLRYVFPAQIDKVLELEVARLERRRELLMKSPFSAPPPREAIVLPAALALRDWPNPPRAHRAELTMPATGPESP
jgi:hypothetical protein